MLFRMGNRLPPVREASRGAVTERRGDRSFVLWVVVGALSTGLLGFSQTGFYYDEGFPLLAAQLINAGKRSYADFFTSILRCTPT